MFKPLKNLFQKNDDMSNNTEAQDLPADASARVEILANILMEASDRIPKNATPEQEAEARVEQLQISGYRIQISQIMMQSVLKEVTDPNNPLPVNRKTAKLWAIALSQMIGMLAGLSVKPEFTDAAVAERLSEAKRIATRIAQEVAKTNTTATTNTASATAQPAAPAINTEAIERDAARRTREGHLNDLEVQAELEQNPEAKAALMRMAETLRKDLELDKKAS